MFRTFAELIPECSGSVLEVGAIPSEKSLLCLPQLRKAERIGLNIDGPHDYAGFRTISANGNNIPFDDNKFDLVICAAVIEHDPFFWRTVAEIKRVVRPGGQVVIGAPGFRRFRAFERLQYYGRKFLPWLADNAYGNAIFTSTIAFQVHNCPGDYYRFSEQAFRDVIMAGLARVKVKALMLPPRFIAVGTKPKPDAR